MRLAVFGGTFDPVHCAHLRVARAAADAFALDRVLFAPTGHQPLKSEPAASFEDRLAMVSLALCQPCADDASPDSRLSVTSLDGPRPDGQPNYTVDLLERFARLDSSDELFAIAGADSFLTLPRWRSPERVLDLAEWIVISRPGLELAVAGLPATDFLARPEFAPLALTAEQRARIHLLRGIHEDISATALRRQVPASATNESAAGSVDRLLPPAVATYIRDHRLYRI